MHLESNEKALKVIPFFFSNITFNITFLKKKKKMEIENEEQNILENVDEIEEDFEYKITSIFRTYTL